MANQTDLKFVVDSSQLTTANKRLDAMETNLKDVQRTSKATQTQFKGVGKNLGHTFQNAGYQVVPMERARSVLLTLGACDPLLSLQKAVKSLIHTHNIDA